MKNLFILLFGLFSIFGTTSCTPDKNLDFQEEQSIDPPPSQEEEEEPDPSS